MEASPTLTLDSLYNLIVPLLLSPSLSLGLLLTHLILSPPHLHPSTPNLAPTWPRLHVLTNSPTLYPYYAHLAITISLRLLAAIDALLAPGSRPRKLVWSNEVVLITGGAGGLGRCLAEVFAVRGVDCAVVDVGPEDEEINEGAEVQVTKSKRGRTQKRRRADEWEELGCKYYCCDVGDRDAVNTLRRRVEQDVRYCHCTCLADWISY